MNHTHPKKREDGATVKITKPHAASAIAAWDDTEAIATATPECPLPAMINSVSATPLADAPTADAGWEALVAGADFTEPPMPSVSGRQPAAGVVTIEPDGRVWVVAPTNGFGGYTATFPKGRLDGLTPRAAAIREAYEESGLRVELTGYLCDAKRSTTITRYYTARRLGGTPADMGWESQAVMLVPAGKLTSVASHANDQPVVQAVLAHINKGA